MGLDKPTIGIIGGRGKMGAWFATFFKRQGLEVICIGSRGTLSPEKMVPRCDVVVVSVPMEMTPQVIRRIGPLVSEEALLMDLTSLKQKPMESMLRYSLAEVVGTHPLFGPEARIRDGLTIAICPGRGKKGLQWLFRIFARSRIKPVIIDPEEHDRKMGIVQGVNHFMTLALARCISRSGWGLEELKGAATQSFGQSLARTQSLFDQSPDLFRGLLMENPESAEAIRSYLDACEEILAIIKRRDGEKFKTLFESLGAFANGRGPVMKEEASG